MPWNIRKQKIAKIISTIISLLQKLLLLVLLTNWSITKHKSKQHISKRKVYRIWQIFFFFSLLKLSQAISSLSPADVPTRNVSPNFIIDITIIEYRSNSMGAVMTRNSEMFSSLLSDTEQHFRQHRDSLSPRVENRSAIVHSETSANANSSTSSEESREEKATTSLEAEKREKSEHCEKGKEYYSSSFHTDIGNSQSLAHQDQCCPGFTMTKSGKTRHQNTGCCIA